MIGRAGALMAPLALGAALSIAPPGVPMARAQAGAEDFVQGVWHHAGTVPGSVPGRDMSFFIEWRFARGRFVQRGHPPLHGEGRYRVLFADATLLRLELFEQRGNFSDRDGGRNRTIEIAIDARAQTISVDRGPPLRRKPASE